MRRPEPGTESEAERALRECQERYRCLAAACAQVMWATDGSGQVVADLPDWRHLTGQHPEEVLGSGWLAAIHPDDRDRLGEAFREARQTAQPFQAELRLRLADGSYRSCLARGVPLLDEHGVIREWVGTCADITEYRLLEAQFQQAQKMEALGRLAVGIAHDYNNMLSVIRGYTELLLMATQPEDHRYMQLMEIMTVAERACGLTRQLLLFSRGQSVQPEPLNLNEVICGMKTMLGRLIGEDVDLTTLLAPGLPHILVSCSNLEQILLNLAVNARDAMPEGGILRIETRWAELTKAEAAQSFVQAPPGHYVMLEVTDTGGGIDAKSLPHIFEPFYSTKSPGTGTGLGLATVYTIVQQSRGAILVSSEPGRGASFKLYWPSTDVPNGGEEEPRDTPSQLGRRTVLLAEDAAKAGHPVREVLEWNGYTVLSAATGQEAVEISRHTGQIDVLLTDVVLPGMNGRELAERVRASHPGVRVVFMSAYGGGALLHRGVSTRADSCLQKPFTPLELTLKLREVLTGDAQ